MNIYFYKFERMPDYTNGKIYKIVKKDDHTQSYIGSTVVELKLRFQKHKADSKFKPTPFHKKVYGKWEEWEIILIENYVCSSKKELTKREGELIRELGTLNFEIAGRTPKEYYQDNLEYCREKNKKYSKQCGDLHREEIREKWKIYFEGKKDKINEKKRQKWAENREENNRKKQERRALKKLEKLKIQN